MNTIIILSGLPGTGKSTLAKKLCHVYPNIKHFSLENARRQLKHKTYMPEKNFEVLCKIYKDIQQAMHSGVDIIFDSNASQSSRRLEVINLASHYNYLVLLVVCECSEELAKERIKNRLVKHDGLYEEPNTPHVFNILKKRWIPISEKELAMRNVNYISHDSLALNFEKIHIKSHTSDEITAIINKLQKATSSLLS